jgi:asparagine synthase (glutamine-hydrolysing)
MTAMGKEFFSENLRREVGEHSVAERVAGIFGLADGGGKFDPLNRAQEIEIKTLLPGYILSSQGDRMLMAHSVEGRFPFLDHRVVEFCMRIPPGLRMNGLTEKHILRESMRNLLPAEIRKMVKQPYRAPDAKCFIGESGDGLVEEMLSPGRIGEKGYFDPRQVERLVSKFHRNPVTGFKDNMAFVGILSTQLLDQIFVRDFRADREIDPSLVRAVEAPELTQGEHIRRRS